jgi:nicotinamidase-related amidase
MDPFSHPIPNSVLLVVDMNRNHLDPSLELLPLAEAEIERVIHNGRRALEFFRSQGVPVVFVTTDSHYDRDGLRIDGSNPFLEYQATHAVPGVGRRRTRHFVAGRSDIVAPLAPLSGEPIVVKRRYTAFTTTDLDLLLRTLGAKHLYLTGVNTNNCILSHAFEAFNRDYGVTVLADCCGSMNGPEYHQAALKLIKAALGWVTTMDDVIASVGAGTPPTVAAR